MVDESGVLGSGPRLGREEMVLRYYVVSVFWEEAEV